jgi:hypothetical protein
MSYCNDYDKDGEPKSILKPIPESPLPRQSHREITDNFSRTIYNLNAADELFERLRDEGMSYAEARAKIEEFLRA